MGVVGCSGCESIFARLYRQVPFHTFVQRGTVRLAVTQVKYLIEKEGMVAIGEELVPT